MNGYDFKATDVRFCVFVSKKKELINTVYVGNGLFTSKDLGKKAIILKELITVIGLLHHKLQMEVSKRENSTILLRRNK